MKLEKGLLYFVHPKGVEFVHPIVHMVGSWGFVQLT